LAGGLCGWRTAWQGGALTTYGYDAQNRLVSETDPATGLRTDYQYDPAGNRTLKAVYDALGALLSQTTYTYDLAGELTAVDDGTRTYDPAGNLLSDGRRTYAWDAENRLIEVRDQATGALVASFTYDGFGRRLSRTTTAGTVFYHYDGGKVTCETDAAGNILAAYTYGPDGGPATLRYQGQTYFYHTNDRGDVLGLTAASGAVVTSYRYDAWGNVLEATGPVAVVNPYRYAGYRQDDSTGLYHLKTRYYDAAIGRFLSRDAVLGQPKEATTLNGYAYAKSNPITYVDPDGRWSWRATNKVATTVGGIASAVAFVAAVVLSVAAAPLIATVVAFAGMLSVASSLVSIVATAGEFRSSNGQMSKTDYYVNQATNVASLGLGIAGRGVRALASASGWAAAAFMGSRTASYCSVAYAWAPGRQ